ncbi:MAG: esterase/lipase family protein [Saprospiraceae bacterium]
MKVKEYQIEQSPQPWDMKRAPLTKEIHSVFQPMRLLFNYRRLTKKKIGNGQRIMLFPGWKSHETVMYPMKSYLKTIGYAPEYWGLGINHGHIERYRDEILERLRQEDDDEKITLVGWSLGGLVAREIAREFPEKIASVVTYGTPVIGGPKYTIGAKVWGKKETIRINNLLDELNETKPISVPMSIIFTKKDSVVTWSACLDEVSENVEHYEVQSTHLSLGIDPKVWKIVLNHLRKYA